MYSIFFRNESIGFGRTNGQVGRKFQIVCAVLYYRTSRNQKIIFAVNIKVKGKGSPCSIIERVRELIPVLGNPRNPYEGCYHFRCLVSRGTMGVNSLPKTVTRQRRGFDLNSGPSAPESSTLTTRLPSDPAVNMDDGN